MDQSKPFKTLDPPGIHTQIAAIAGCSCTHDISVFRVELLLGDGSNPSHEQNTAMKYISKAS